MALEYLNLVFRRTFQNSVFYPLLFAGILTLALLPYYVDGTIILGGEADLVLDFSIHWKAVAYQWISRYYFGIPSLVSGSNGANALFHLLVQVLSGNQAVTNFFFVFPLYYAPFLGMYLLATQFKAKPYLAFLISASYVINPFYLPWLTNLNEWNVYAGAMLPLLFWVVLRYYHDNLKLFLFYGLVTTVFSFAYTNQPFNAIINIASIISVYIVSYYYNKRFLMFEAIRKYLLIFSAFLLFNSWWLINLFYSVGYAQRLYRESGSFSEDWLLSTVSSINAPLAKAFLLRQIVNNANEDFFGYFYHTPLSLIVTLIPLLLIVGGIFFTRETGSYKLNINIFIIVLIALFLTKGAAQPFGGIYLFLFKNLPFFNIFKTPVEKFGLLYIFLLTVLLLFVLHSCREQKVYRKAIILFSGYLFFCFIPVLTGNIIPDGNMNATGVMSRRFVDKPEYRAAREDINKDKLDYRTLSLPGMGNYQVLMDNYGGKKYTGLDPILNNTDKPYTIAIDENEKVIYRNLGDDSSDALLSLFNIGKLVINGEFIPWFGITGPDADSLRHKFENLPKKEFGNIAVFDNAENFVPHLYIPSSYWIIESSK